ncbi:MAG: hypothetical protein GY930_20215 [bacterium]|nr:hypothetical protein [bacterium]
MKVDQRSSQTLALQGRRVDGEVGEKGMWLNWLVSAAFVGLGGVFVVCPEDREMQVVGWIGVLGGCALALFSLYLQCRHERLELDLVGRSGSYATRVWPRAWSQHFEFSLADVKRVELRFKIESPGGAKGPSGEYPTWQVLLIARPRRKLPLERTGSEQVARELAALMARVLEVPFEDRTPNSGHHMHANEDALS